MIRLVEQFADGWAVVQRYAAGLLLIVMTGLYGFNVLLRSLLPQYAATFAWIEEGTRYMAVWLVFLGAGIALEVGRHILIDLVWHKLGRRQRRALFAVVDVVGVLFCALMTVLAFELSLFIAETGQISPTLGIPAYVLYVAPVVGFASLTLGFLLRLFGVRDARIERPNPEWLGGGAQ
jgi:TRAP-type C4-dicarboxylate transport system permease small subunit